MANTAPLLLFSWPAQPEARVGAAFAVGDPKRPQVEVVRIPYPFKRTPAQHPLEREAPRLFEAVAELETAAADAVEAFARSWGLLFERGELLSLNPTPGGPVRWMGQRLEAWRQAAAELREARELWRAICENDREAIGEFVRLVHRENQRKALYRGIRGGFVVPRPRQSLSDAARVVLAKLVSERSSTTLEVAYDAKAPRRLRSVARPRSLLAAAWAQLGEYVTRDEARACPRCGRIFVANVDAPGRQREYCSDACRVAMSRRRATREKKGG